MGSDAVDSARDHGAVDPFIVLVAAAVLAVVGLVVFNNAVRRSSTDAADRAVRRRIAFIVILVGAVIGLAIGGQELLDIIRR